MHYLLIAWLTILWLERETSISAFDPFQNHHDRDVDHDVDHGDYGDYDDSDDDDHDTGAESRGRYSPANSSLPRQIHQKLASAGIIIIINIIIIIIGACLLESLYSSKFTNLSTVLS